MSDEEKQVERLSLRLFKLIEGHQGYFHVADGESFPSKRAFFDRLRNRLHHGERAVKIMRDFIKQHDSVHT